MTEHRADACDMSHTDGVITAGRSAAGSGKPATQRMAELGREAACRAATYVRDGVDRATGYAHQLGDMASERIADVTGQPPERWAQQVRHAVEHSPLKAMGLAVAAGYLLGRAARRG